MTQASITQLPLDQLVRDDKQPRIYFSQDGLDGLAASIKSQGLLQPVLVRSIPAEFTTDGRNLYKLIAGERRWRASGLAGLATIDCIIRDDMSEADLRMAALLENIQRESLSCVEQGAALVALQEMTGQTLRALAEGAGMSHTNVKRLLDVGKLTRPVALAVCKAGLGLGHVALLTGLPEKKQLYWIDRVVAKGISVRKLNTLLAEESAATADGNEDMKRLERVMGEHLGCNVAINYSAGRRGSVSIDFTDLDVLQGLLERLKVPFE